MPYSIKDYSYEFPEELIALYPAKDRCDSRLMVLDRKSRRVAHGNFRNITDYFQQGDVLVVNVSKVFPCRLITRRATGGRQEILLLHRETRINDQAESWRLMINAGRKIKKGDTFEFENLRITILDNGYRERTALLEFEGNLPDILDRIADMPLPPYIRRKNTPLDRERYQTIFARNTGSVAAPTAGLHFTPEIIATLQEKGVQLVEVTLHVGPGTFLPVRHEDIRRHEMHAEYFSITQDACDMINAAKSSGRRITAVGTTTVRVLETIAGNSTPLAPQTGSTNIFIYPPHEFKIVDRLITNFHQPESTLLMLTCAFAERDFIMSAYREAVQEKYRLFSYGDCMLIL